MANPKTEQILETVREIREARKLATQGEWDVQGGIYIFSGPTMVADNNDDNAVLRARGVGGGMSEEQQENNVVFCAMAANKIDQLCEVIQTMTEALYFYSRTGTWENYGSPALEDSGVTATEAINSAAEILGRDKG